MDKNDEVLKCPIINGVLCYTSTARHSVRNDDIVRICLAFFRDDEIIKGKDILCSIIGEKSKRRRHENRIMHELRDILDILKRCDDENCELPKFVVDSYDGLPPTSGFEIIAQSLTTLNDEILSLRKEIEYLKDNRIEQTITIHDMSMMKEDLIMIKGELKKINHRGLSDDIRRNSFVLEHLQDFRKTVDYTDSDIPDNVCASYNAENSIRSSNILPSAPLMESDNLLEIVNRSLQDNGGPPSAPVDPDRSYQDEGGPPSAPSYAQVIGNNAGQINDNSNFRSSLVNASEMHSKTTTSSLISVETNVQKEPVFDEKSPNVDEEGFTLVRNKKKTRENIVGNKRYSGNRVLKSARKVVDLYLGNLDLDVTENEIIEYIKEETNISVDNFVSLNSKNPNCKAFKISVSLESRMKLLLPEIWPEGVICRKFYNPRNK